MRKVSIVILVVVILAGVLFIIFHTRRQAQQSITGIGVMLTVRDHQLKIINVLPDTPAAKAGLHPGLIIQQIDGTNIVGTPLVECVAMTRGPVGSMIQLEVIDSTKSQTNIVEFTREKFSVPVAKPVL
jgi:carboxyl-terminal processing protease